MNRRRRMLSWLRRYDFPAYCYVIHKLGLKDIYMDAVRCYSYCCWGTWVGL